METRDKGKDINNSKVDNKIEWCGFWLSTRSHSLHAEIIKECMTEVMDTMFEGKQKEQIFNKIFNKLLI